MRIGVDIGATKTEVVLLDPDGAVRGLVRARTPRASSIAVEVARLADGLLADAGRHRGDVVALGAGIPGLVRARDQMIVHAVNLGITGEGFDLRGPLSEVFPEARIAVANDVKAAALGVRELLHPEVDDLAYLSVGSGLAAGLIVNGALLTGWRGIAGEVGHIPVADPELACACGQFGCLETSASGGGLARSWPEGPDGGAASALFAGDHDGDDRAVAAREVFVRRLVDCIELLVLTVDPEVVVVGGGVAHAGAPLVAALVREFEHRESSSPFLRDVGASSRLSALASGSPVAAIGAALVAHVGASSAEASLR